MNDRKDKSKIEIKGTRTKPHNKERQSTQQYIMKYSKKTKTKTNNKNKTKKCHPDK